MVERESDLPRFTGNGPGRPLRSYRRGQAEFFPGTDSQVVVEACRKPEGPSPGVGVGGHERDERQTSGANPGNGKKRHCALLPVQAFLRHMGSFLSLRLPCFRDEVAPITKRSRLPVVGKAMFVHGAQGETYGLLRLAVAALPRCRRFAGTGIRRPNDVENRS